MEKPLKCIFTDLEIKAVSTARKELFYHLHTFIKDNNDNDVDLSRFIKYIKHWSTEKKFFFGAKNLKTDFSYICYAEFKYEISFFSSSSTFLDKFTFNFRFTLHIVLFFIVWRQTNTLLVLK